MADMNERDIASLRGDYNVQLRRADKLEEALLTAQATLKLQKASIDTLSADNSKLLRKLNRQKNRK